MSVGLSHEDISDGEGIAVLQAAVATLNRKTASRSQVNPKSHKGEEATMEVILYVEHVGGKGYLSDVERNVRWKERFESSCGPLPKFLEARPHAFHLSAERDAVTTLSKKVKPDQTRAPLPREKARLREVPTGAGNQKIMYMCVAASMDLEALQKRYHRLDMTSILSNGVLHVTNIKGYGATSKVSGQRFDLFVFAYGSLVLWCTDNESEKMVLRDFLTAPGTLGNITKDRYSQASLDELFPLYCTFAISTDDDLMESGKFLEALQRDHILLQSDRPVFKQVVSHALAQSAKLDVIEPKIAELLRICKPLPLHIRDKGHADIPEKKINKLKAEVHFYRMELKSDSELLDEPEFFWEKPEFKPLFSLIRDDLLIESRVMLLNEKLSALLETLSMIGEQFETEHSQRLEWIVIILVLAEVLIAVAELLFETDWGLSLLARRK